MGFEPGFGSGSERYFTEDNEKPERLFCVVIRGGYAGAPEEGKEGFLFGSYEIAAEGLGRFETKGLVADFIELARGVFFDLGRCLPGEITGFEFFSNVAES